MLCLMYHRIPLDSDYADCSGPEKRFSLPVSRFRQQIEYLRSNQFEFMTLQAAIDAIRTKRVSKKKAVLLTFDDGCRSVYDNAFPLLRVNNVPAAVFVTTDPASSVFQLNSENESRLTQQQLQTLSNKGITIGSHGLSHRPLTGLSYDQIVYELTASKQTLEQMISKTVDLLAVPGNWIDKSVIEVAQQVGYRAVFTSHPGRIGCQTNLFRIPRINIEGTLSLEQFRHRISMTGLLKKKTIGVIKQIPANLLGPKRWIPIRKKIISLLK